MGRENGNGNHKRVAKTVQIWAFCCENEKKKGSLRVGKGIEDGDN